MKREIKGPITCRRCCPEDMLPVRYDELRRGEIAIGGCAVTGKDPLWACATGNYGWSRHGGTPDPG